MLLWNVPAYELCLNYLVLPQLDPQHTYIVKGCFLSQLAEKD